MKDLITVLLLLIAASLFVFIGYNLHGTTQPPYIKDEYSRDSVIAEWQKSDSVKDVLFDNMVAENWQLYRENERLRDGVK